MIFIKSIKLIVLKNTTLINMLNSLPFDFHQICASIKTKIASLNIDA